MDRLGVPFPHASCFTPGEPWMPIVLARNTLLRQEPCNRVRGHPLLAQAKDAADHGCLRFIDLPSPTMLFPNIAVPKRDGTPGDMAGLRPSDKSPLEAFQDFRPLVLRQRPAHLKEEPALWSLLQRMRHDQQLHAGPFEFLRQQELMPEVP